MAPLTQGRHEDWHLLAQLNFRLSGPPQRALPFVGRRKKFPDRWRRLSQRGPHESQRLSWGKGRMALTDEWNSLARTTNLQSHSDVVEAPPRLELGNRGFAVRCLTTWLWRRISDLRANSPQIAVLWSGQRGSNSLPPPWQGGALPDELCPQRTPLWKRGGASGRS